MWRTVTFLLLLAQSMWKEILILILKVLYCDYTCAEEGASWHSVIHLCFCTWEYNNGYDSTQGFSDYLNNYNYRKIFLKLWMKEMYATD